MFGCGIVFIWCSVFGDWFWFIVVSWGKIVCVFGSWSSGWWFLCVVWCVWWCGRLRRWSVLSRVLIFLMFFMLNMIVVLVSWWWMMMFGDIFNLMLFFYFCCSWCSWLRVVVWWCKVVMKWIFFKIWCIILLGFIVFLIMGFGNGVIRVIMVCWSVMLVLLVWLKLFWRFWMGLIFMVFMVMVVVFCWFFRGLLYGFGVFCKGFCCGNLLVRKLIVFVF